jgi:hypothetical protein
MSARCIANKIAGPASTRADPLTLNPALIKAVALGRTRFRTAGHSRAACFAQASPPLARCTMRFFNTEGPIRPDDH